MYKGSKNSGREIWVCKHTSSSSPASPTWSGGFQYVLDGVTARAKTRKGGEKRLPQCGIKQLCTFFLSFFPLPFFFPFLSFFFAAVKIGFSLLVNAGGASAAAAAAAMSKALCKPPFPECEILRRQRRSCE